MLQRSKAFTKAARGLLTKITTSNTAKNVRFAHGCCHHYFPSEIEGEGDYAFEIHANSFKFGSGVLREVGEDAKELGLKNKRVALFTDRVLSKMEPVATAKQALQKAGCDVVVYDEIQVEPTDKSFKNASRFAIEGKFDGFVSVGGGSVMDTAKAANLYSTYPVADLDNEESFLTYVNQPIGKGAAVPGELKPHIACPTTCGTGSECTGFAIFDLLSMKAKTGIAHKHLRPTKAVIDPSTTLSLPANVVAASGFDVLSHALESYTAMPYTRRIKGFKLGQQRPINQGSNPYTDMGCLEALRLTSEYIVRAVNDPTDVEAREQMMFASTLAGTAMGGAGVHLPHGMSYAVSGLVRDFRMEGYPQEEPLVPHGVSVILNAPSVFRFTAKANPHRHLRAAECLGADVRGASPEDAGGILYDRLVEIMKATHMPNGLQSVGYDLASVPDLVKGAFPQKRVIDNAPIRVTEEDLAQLFRGAMKYW